MSGRIRTVKPEWLQDERIGAASDEARTLSIGLILLADDHGNGRAHEMFIASQVWSYGDPRETLTKASRALRELVALGFIGLYEHAGQRYYHITHWSRHQRVDKPGKPLVPQPVFCENGLLVVRSRESREPVAKVPESPREVLAPDLDQDQDLEQGGEHEGSGDLRRTGSAPPSPESRKPKRQRRAADVTPETQAVFDHWVAVHVPSAQRDKCILNAERAKKINARLSENYTVDRLKAAIDGVLKSPWHLGENPERKRHTGLTTILRDGEQVEKFEALATGAAVPRLGLVRTPEQDRRARLERALDDARQRFDLEAEARIKSELAALTKPAAATLAGAAE